MALEWILFQIFINTVEIGVLFYLLCSKFPAKGRAFVPTLIFIIGGVGVLSLRIFIPALENLPTTEIFTTLSCFIYLYFYREGQVLKKIFWVIIAQSLLFAIAFASISIISLIAGIYTIDIVLHQPSTERLIVMIISKTLQIIIFYLLSKKGLYSETKIYMATVQIMICFIISLISLIIAFFIYVSTLRGINIPENLTFLISIGLLVINIIVFILYEIINREAEKNYVLIAKNKQYELTKQHNKQVVEMYHKMSEWRHDYANHMQLVVGMLEDENSNSKAIDYIKDLDEKITSASLDIVTGNYIVDAIVSSKATLAAAHNIDFGHKIFLPDDISAIDDAELCAVLSNLLDNAIEACRKLDSGRYINIEMFMVRAQLNIKIINSSNGEYRVENDRFRTTKQGNLHGIGMRHVKSIVETHGGIYDVKPEADSFTVQVSIPLR